MEGYERFKEQVFKKNKIRFITLQRTSDETSN